MLQENHACIANLHLDPETAIFNGGNAYVLGTCRICDEEYELEYEFADAALT